MSLLLTKHISELGLLFNIIKSAKIGKIYPYLISLPELFIFFQDIKISLPTGTDLPYSLNPDTIYDLTKLSDLTVYYSNNNIVFVLTIPLIHQNDFILYHLLPKPVCNQINCMIIKPSHRYLAVSRQKNTILRVTILTIHNVNMLEVSFYVPKSNLFIQGH
jgi:hypothetical protein